jgi:N-formylglutamate amidohydrolase
LPISSPARSRSETGAALLIAHAPRAMIDLNRAPDDVDWDMVAGGMPEPRVRLAAGRRARSGLGLVPRRLPGLGELWKRRMTRDELTARIEQIHQPYHAALAKGLEALRDRWGAALLIDLHSMPPLGPKRGADAAPDFVIGDRFGASCDGALSAAAFDHLTQAGGARRTTGLTRAATYSTATARRDATSTRCRSKSAARPISTPSCTSPARDSPT